MAINTDETPDRITLEPDESWLHLDPQLKDPSRLDPAIAWVATLIDAGDWDQVYWRTGMRLGTNSVKDDPLPLLLEFAWTDISIEGARIMLGKLGLEVPGAYFLDILRQRPAHVTASLAVRVRSRDDGEGWRSSLRQQIADILNEPRVVRLELPEPVQAFNHDALGDIGLSDTTRHYKGEFLDGSKVVIGVIDDGCAFAHQNFLKPRAGGAFLETRIVRVWDQARTRPNGGWQAPQGLDGFELTKAEIDAAIKAVQLKNGGDVDENAVYQLVDHEIADLASHGTHVMGIAAGNGRPPMGCEGIAPGADIIFVQLPAAAIESGGVALGHSIVQGMTYILANAEAKPVVINISYGGYFGPHDGTSFVEETIDAVLAQPNRAVVVAAGNGYEADCHAHGELAQEHDNLIWRWVVKPQDPTPNVLGIWYNRAAELALYLTAPNGTSVGPVNLGARPQNIKIGSKRVGRIDHKKTTAGYRPNLIRIDLNQTSPREPDGTSDPAPSGTWKLRLENVGNVAATLDAWIERDTSGRPGGARRQQSHFHPDDADARGTLATYATGKLAVSVGAYNTATQEVCRYSACGPTRDERPKPDVLAPAEEDAAGRGVLCASSRSALPTRMNGTSASAPQVAGLVALLFQYAMASGRTLTVADVLNLLTTGAMNAESHRLPLHPNRHINADPNRKDKQGDPDIWPNLMGAGRISWPDTIVLM